MNRLYISDEQLAELKKLGDIHAAEFHKVDLSRIIAQAMRSACPVPGKEFDKLVTVVFPVGGHLPPHKHKRQAVLYYPEVCDPIIIDGEVIYTEKGQIIHLMPGTEHEVPATKSERVSCAMLVTGV